MNHSLRQLMRVELRRKRRLWIAALCASSFMAGQMLFGDEPQPQQSRISQYLQAKLRLTSGADDEGPVAAKTQGSATNSGRRAALSGEPTTPSSGQPVEVVANPLPLENKPVDEENLPPIIPASAMPRPRPKNRQPGIAAQPSSASMGSAPTTIQQPKPSQWRIDLGGNPLPSISVEEPEAPLTPPQEGPLYSPGPQSPPALPESPSGPWNPQPSSASGQTTGAIQNPFVSPRKQWATATDMEPAMPRTLFPSQLSPATTSSAPQPGSREIIAAPAPYPMPLEIINPNVTRRPVTLTGANEPVPVARVAQAAPASGEGNPLRPAAKVEPAEASQAPVGSPPKYDEPRLLVEPLSKDAAAKTGSSGNLKQVEPPTAGPPPQKSSRRRYMLEK